MKKKESPLISSELIAKAAKVTPVSISRLINRNKLFIKGSAEFLESKRLGGKTEYLLSDIQCLNVGTLLKNTPDTLKVKAAIIGVFIGRDRAPARLNRIRKKLLTITRTHDQEKLNIDRILKHGLPRVRKISEEIEENEVPEEIKEMNERFNFCVGSCD